MVRRDAFEQVRGFDEAFGLGYYEDDDLCLRLRAYGRLLVVPAAFVYHKDGLSFGRLKGGAAALSWRRTIYGSYMGGSATF